MTDEIVLNGKTFNFLPQNNTTNPYGLGGDGHNVVAPGEEISNLFLLMEETVNEAQSAAGYAGSAANGYGYVYSTTTTASDPGAGNLRFNNTTLSSATALYISETTSTAQSLSAILAAWDDGTSTIKGRLRMFSIASTEIFAEFNITGTLTDNGTWDTFTVAYVAGSGSFINDDAVGLTFTSKGDKGDTGATGSAGSTYDISASSDDTFSNIVNLPFSSGSGSAENKKIAKATFLSGVAADSTFNSALFGLQKIWVPAGFVKPSATGGCAAVATIASAANQPDITTCDFDATTQEYAQFQIRMPEQWDEGTITFQAVWSHDATTTNFGVVWDLQAVAISDDDTILTNFGTAQTSTDTGGTTSDIYISPASSAITVAGTPQAGDWLACRVSRVTGNGSDTMAIDARLHGIILGITTVKGNDA